MSSMEMSNPLQDTVIEDQQKKARLKCVNDVKDTRLRKTEIKEKMKDPVSSQPEASKRGRVSNDESSRKKQKTSKIAKFPYGNYDRYYGYRNPRHDLDPRLTMFAQRKELFSTKDILDIGCNIGHITLSIARDFAARSVAGIDIDKKLINIARKNVKHYVNCIPSQESTNKENLVKKQTNVFPTSFSSLIRSKPTKGFPYNVTFVQGNYVLEDDVLLSIEQPQFDTILCLSITKWIHLNFGDEGLKRSFKRMYAQLRPGGVLILEPQDWSSYSKRKGLTEQIHKTYESIKFRPNDFTPYLLSAEVGFQRYEIMSVPKHLSKGFQRPIYLFTKAGTASSIESPPPVRVSSEVVSNDADNSEDS